MTWNVRFIATIIGAAFLVQTQTAQATQTGDWKIEGILVEQAWARVQAGAGRTGAVYLTIHNTSLADDFLLAVESPAARSTAVHQTSIKNGVARMTPVPFGVELLAGEEVVLRPGAMHVMLSSLSDDIQPGGKLPIVLVFRDAGALSVEIPILENGEKNPDVSHGGHKP